MFLVKLNREKKYAKSINLASDFHKKMYNVQNSRCTFAVKKIWTKVSVLSPCS